MCLVFYKDVHTCRRCTFTSVKDLFLFCKRVLFSKQTVIFFPFVF